MTFDYKKKYKEFYLPPLQPTIVDIPTMNFIAVKGKGSPHQEDGAYKQAVGLLYTIAYTIKMSPRKGYDINGYFDYVVPPLEGFWWQDDHQDLDIKHKEDFQWVSFIRLPDFVSEDDVDWAKHEAYRKKQKDFSLVKFLTYHEGLCVQCMHRGSYDEENKTIELMKQYAKEYGYIPDFKKEFFHHEIYLSDPRRVKVDRLKTVIRFPIIKRS